MRSNLLCLAWTAIFGVLAATAGCGSDNENTTSTTSNGGSGGTGGTTQPAGGGGAGGESTGGSGGGKSVESCAATWTHHMPGSLSPSFVHGLAPDASGGLFVAGSFTGAVDLGEGLINGDGVEEDRFLLKLDAAGEVLWTRHFAAAGGQGVGVLPDGKGGMFLSGRFADPLDFATPPLAGTGLDDTLFARLDGDGNVLWSKVFTDTEGMTLGQPAVDEAGNIYFSGRFEGTIDLGGGPLTDLDGPRDIFVAKFDAKGNHVWSQAFGDPGDDGASPFLTLDPAGNVVLWGAFLGSIDFGGGPLVSAGDKDLYLVKLDAEGKHVQSLRFGDAQGQTAAWMTPLPSGGLLLSGLFFGGFELAGGDISSPGSKPSAFVAQLDKEGKHVWSHVYTSTEYLLPTSLAADEDGNVFLAGLFFGDMDLGGEKLSAAGDLNFDVFLVKLDAEGNHLFSAQYGDEKPQGLAIVSLDASGQPVLGGNFAGSIDFGAGPITNAPPVPPYDFDPDFDLYVTRLACSPTTP